METILSTTSSTPPGARSTFLTVICILTFIGSGWGIIKCIRDYASADTVSKMANEVLEKRESQMREHQIDEEKTPSFVKKLIISVTENIGPESIRTYSVIGLISSLLKLTGAILMWNLKKMGFYFYVAGVAVIVVIPLFMGQLIGIISGSIRGFVGVIFIVMYALNLKYMNKAQLGSTNQ